MAVIHIIGGYGKGNLGDDLIERALTQLLDGADLTFSWVGRPHGPEELTRCDHVIVGGGSHWPAPLLSALAAAEVDVPFSLVGISARHALPPPETRAILDRARTVIVRDRASARLLHDHPRITVGPDLTWLCPLAPADPTADRRSIGLNLRFWPHRPDQTREIARIVRRTAVRVVPLPCFGGDPNAFPVETRRDQAVLAAAGVDGPGRIEPDTVRQCGLVVGMRLHALILAAQAGVPFIGFDDHPKTVAFCRETGMAAFCVPLAELDARLPAALARARADYDEIRAHLRRVRRTCVEQARSVYGPVRAALPL
ncbi:MAG: polysaccharide pyruvyl transferase family protein [Kiritimatiellae bacterium]|nr:polysaccharide pyruvyl transferase family protein [Kiritimatiellia bacterium]